MKKILPKTMKVELTLEESGWICHLLMAQLLQPVPSRTDSFLKWPSIIDAVKKRQERLYIKIAAANDKLMGKK